MSEERRRKRHGNPLFKRLPPPFSRGDAPSYLALEAAYRFGWYLWARNEMDDFNHAKEFFSMQLDASMRINDLRCGYHAALMQSIDDCIKEFEERKP